MMTMITPVAKFVCDRCGISRIITERDGEKVLDVMFYTDALNRKITHKRGQVCERCYEDFIEIAENFFDESNFQ